MSSSSRSDILSFLSHDGRLRAFELPDRYTTLNGLCYELERLEGVVPDRGTWVGILRKPDRCHFEYRGALFEVCEMNDGFWVGPLSQEDDRLDLTSMRDRLASRIVGNEWHRLLAILLPN
jgi:hypothetical protein